MGKTNIDKRSKLAKERYESQMERLRKYSPEAVTEKNNIFDFATSEFSQDAFIAWCLNWYHYPEHKLCALADDLLNYILEGVLNIEEIDSLEILRQKHNIDILVRIETQGERYAILLEDKTNSFEHSNQIERYIEKLVGTEGYQRKNIIPVYFKTGFWFDCDFLVNCDITIDAWSFCSILQRYEGLHSLVDYFIAFLHSKICAWKESLIHLNNHDYAAALKDHIGQYLLMRGCFEEWPTWTSSGSPELYWAELGTNFGSPWLQYTVWRQGYPQEYAVGSEQMLFWRIDKYTVEGVSKWALSLKHYSVKAKDAAAVADAVRNRAYQHFRTQIKKRVQAELKKQSDCSVTYTEINRKRNSGEKTNERQVLTMYFDENPSLVQHIAQSITRCLKSHHFPNDHLEGEAE
ncbi:PD-(D/E)XK nuclease family protein [Ruminococcaceae bacterium OttesenSCG-928-A16]|nr:PD-(D/E)XK nuclease family protein [Ruminococcaceae bacterium OttesenSCG-928-A16]